MKIIKTKTLVVLMSMCCVNTIISQNFQGKATYISKKDMTKSVQFDDAQMSDNQKAKMATVLKKMGEKTYELNFNKIESIYKEIQTLDNSGNNNFYDPDVKYKNIQNTTRIFESDIMLKPFLIVDKLDKLAWQLEDKTKKIGMYTCYKAILKIPVSKEDLQEFNREKKYLEKSKTNFYKLAIPQEQVITAWYAADIPVSHGPDIYWGLPGLILEINDGTTILLCTKLVLNPKVKFLIKKPTQGKMVTQKQFDKIETDKINSMRNKNGAIQINVQSN